MSALLLTALLSALPSPAHAAAWLLNGSLWNCRRAIEVKWEADKATGDEMAQVEFHTAGYHKPNGQDIRLALADGTPIPVRIIQIGPGDRIVILFPLVKSVRTYQVYFGNDGAPRPRDELTNVPIRAGLFMETRMWPGTPVDNYQQIENTWRRAQAVLGRCMVERPYLGLIPFGEQDRTISRFSGTLYAPADGSYTFAASGDDRAALHIDGKPLVFAPWGAWDIRFKATTTLKRGRHDFVFYHVNTGGEMRMAAAWQPPGAARVEAIPAEAFGAVKQGVAGPLEMKDKTLVADFSAQYQGECFFANHYSHRVKLAAQAPKAADRAAYLWDFGDGITSTAAQVDHIYLAPGIYPVRLTVRVGANSDTQTTRLSVNRDFAHLDRPPTDSLSQHATIVRGYDLSRTPPGLLPWAVWLHLRSTQWDALAQACQRLGAAGSHPDLEEAISALKEANLGLLTQQRVDQALSVWKRVPADSKLQPWAAKQQAQILLWWKADFPAALEALEPFLKTDDDQVKRIYAQALVLNQKPQEAEKILQSLPLRDNAQRRAALSGAMARTIEFYVAEGDSEAGEESWDKWQIQSPTDFLEGYSVLLRVKLMERRGLKQPAARIAEAFALALPTSSYAPQLLDRAGELLAESDPDKSKALRQLLKQKYPEDPLSQD